MATGVALSGEEGDFIIDAIRRWHVIETSDRENRDQQQFSQRFYAGEQWDDDILERRRTSKRPVITINRLPEPVRHVTNAQRRERPRINILPIDSGADVRTAEMLQGLIRSIENNSNASAAYFTAGENAAISGRGWIRVMRRYVNPRVTLDQELAIKRVRFPFSIYMDTGTEELDGRDARYAFAVEDVPEDEFKERWPHAKFTSTRAFASYHHIPERWNLYEKHIRVAEYYYVKYDEQTVRVASLPDGRIVQAEGKRGGLPRGAKVLHTHRLRQRKVYRALISGAEVLEGNDNLTGGKLEPGQWIPIVPVIGEERIATREGRIHQVGIVHDAVDGQRTFNWTKATLLETSMLAPRTPFVIEEGQLEGYASLWKSAHQENYAYLPYKKVLDGSGRAIPPPGRPQSAPAISDMIQLVAQADEDLKSTTRRHDASLGQRGPQESGRAIKQRQDQDEHANFNYIDNLAFSIQHVGRILVDQIPFVYNTARIERILGEDEVTSERIQIQPGFAELPEMQREQVQANLPPGIDGIFDIGMARYDVTIETGPGYSTRRQHAADVMQDLFKAVPSLFAEAGDLLVHFLDVPGGRKLMERLKYQIALRGGLPPEGPDGHELPPEIAATFRRMQQQMEELKKKNQEMQQQIQTDQVKSQARLQERSMDIESRERVAGQKAQADMAKVQADLAGKTQIEQLKAHLQQMLKMVEGEQQAEQIELKGAVDITKIHEQGAVDLEVEQVRAAAAEEAAARSDERQEEAAARSDSRKEGMAARSDARKGEQQAASDERKEGADAVKQQREHAHERQQEAHKIAAQSALQQSQGVQRRTEQGRQIEADKQKQERQISADREQQDRQLEAQKAQQGRQTRADTAKQGRQIDADTAKQRRQIGADRAKQERQVAADTEKQKRDIAAKAAQAKPPAPRRRKAKK